MTSLAPPSSSPKLPPMLYTVFFAVLFFLCCADQFFGIKIHGFNFRFGQGLLFICAIAASIQLRREWRAQSESWNLHFGILKNWLPFFILYFVSAFLSPTPERSFLKLGWALFNIGGACVVCLNTRWSKYLERGIIGGILALSLFLIAQSCLIYWAGLTSPGAGALGNAIYSPCNPWPIFGFVQPCYLYMNLEIFRPCAFYYVPVFAACAMVFGFFLYLGWQKNENPFKTILLGALILCAIILTGARSGILALLVAFTFIVLCAFLQKQFSMIRLIFFIGCVAMIFVGLFALAPEGKKYVDFLLGPLGPHGIESRISNPASSEAKRIGTVLNGIRGWARHPLLGNGVIPFDFTMNGLGQPAENTWVELLMESGLLGFLGFIYAVGRTYWQAFERSGQIASKLFITGGVLAHFIVSLNFTATFPRLDYWILFFFAIHLLVQKKKETSSPKRRRTPGAPVKSQSSR
jgi:hypothetical protein